ncbi:hypothetical protein [uncultured Bacteroides sp.]|uniref:hypothetical protein n=1 Tax=uncultured Bacteroides sp. TaxID=162156 RepID=UPI0026132EF1|nr:hypothetical protein [uncultured Bacteroides sp.]
MEQQDIREMLLLLRENNRMLKTILYYIAEESNPSTIRRNEIRDFLRNLAANAMSEGRF